MQAAGSSVQLLRFGAFELDLQNSELRRGGVLLKVSPQQFQLLRLLAEKAGEVQTREEIQREIWGAGTFGDLDRNLNVCVAQIRSILNDDSDAPRYIQTIPKRGYRFIAPVVRVTALGVAVPEERAVLARSRNWMFAAAGVVVIFGLAATGYLISRRPTHSQRLMIAALPFDNLSNDPAENLLTEGLTEELIGQLGSLNPDRLGVIGRSSVMRFKGAAHGIDQIGRDLRVDYLVEGTVRASSGRVRITARLIKVADQGQVWTETWERAQDEMFRMEEDAAAQIVSAVTSRLLKTPNSQQPRATVQEAYQAYLNGRYLQHKENLADLQRSIAYFEQAAKLDSRFDQALSAAAETYVALGRSGGKPEDTFPRARQTAGEALRLRETNEEAHNALANVFFWYEWNWQQAELHFQRAIAINPSFSLAHHDYAFFLVAMGRTEDGLSSLRRAIASDPLSARVNMDAGWLYLQAHRFDDAIRQARRAQELEPGLAEANACIYRALLGEHKFGEALAISGRLPENRNPETVFKEWLRQRPMPQDPFAQATQYALLGEQAKAMDALFQAYHRRSIMMPMLKTEPSLLPLHSDPRFQDLVRKLALP